MVRLPRILVPLLVALSLLPQSAVAEPFRIAIARLTHTHVHWLFESEKKGDVEIVGIFEPNEELAARYLAQYGKDDSHLYTDLDEMLDEVKPEGLTAFGSIQEHLGIVQAAAPRGIHVMVEKPLAYANRDARRMERLAEEHNIHLLTNYETTWYPTTHQMGAMVTNGELGQVRRAVFRHGHKGPALIGVDDEFLEWLTDPESNGGGALIDFGCYGANIMTWLMDGRRPLSVTAVTAQLQPDLYPKVDDDATITLDYGDAVAVIQGSWNWTFSVKDAVIYGTDGTVTALDRSNLEVQTDEGAAPQRTSLPPREAPLDDPFSLFADVVRGKIELQPTDLSALENNMVVVEILDAARRSAKTGRTITLA